MLLHLHCFMSFIRVQQKGFYIGLSHSGGPIGSWHPAFCSAAGRKSQIWSFSDVQIRDPSCLLQALQTHPMLLHCFMSLIWVQQERGFTLGYPILVAQWFMSIILCVQQRVLLCIWLVHDLCSGTISQLGADCHLLSSSHLPMQTNTKSSFN
jgi:hypothetical protein